MSQKFIFTIAYLAKHYSYQHGNTLDIHVQRCIVDTMCGSLCVSRNDRKFVTFH